MQLQHYIARHPLTVALRVAGFPGESKKKVLMRVHAVYFAGQPLWLGGHDSHEWKIERTDLFEVPATDKPPQFPGHITTKKDKREA